MIELREIPSATVRPTSWKPAKKRTTVPMRWDRRQFLTAGAVGAGAAVLGLIGRLPTAHASHVGTDGYQIDPVTDTSHSTNCYQSAFYQSNAACDVCGPSSSYGTACEVVTHEVGYHRNTGIAWKLRKNDCSHSGYDGWLWKVGNTCCWSCQGASNCETYKETTTRCHDGWKCDTSGANCVKSICQWRTAGTRVGCP